MGTGSDKGTALANMSWRSEDWSTGAGFKLFHAGFDGRRNSEARVNGGVLEVERASDWAMKIRNLTGR